MSLLCKYWGCFFPTLVCLTNVLESFHFGGREEEFFFKVFDMNSQVQLLFHKLPI